MRFKKGDLVEVWDLCWTQAEYFAFNDHPEAEKPHIVHLYKRDGTTHRNIYCYQHCRPARPDLKMDDSVWIYDDMHIFG